MRRLARARPIERIGAVARFSGEAGDPLELPGELRINEVREIQVPSGLDLLVEQNVQEVGTLRDAAEAWIVAPPTRRGEITVSDVCESRRGPTVPSARQPRASAKVVNVLLIRRLSRALQTLGW